MTGTLRERKPGVWELRVSAGRDPSTGKYRTETRRFEGGKRAAAKALDEFAVEIANRQPVSPTTMGELFTMWLDLKAQSLSYSTLTEYRRLVTRRLNPIMGHVPVAQLTVMGLDGYYTHLSQTLSPASVHQVHAVIAGALEQARKWGMISVNPARSATPPSKVKADISPPNVDQMRELLASDRFTEDERVFLQLAAETGARRGELCALTLSDFDFAAGTVAIGKSLQEQWVDGELRLATKGTKTGNRRLLHLSESMLAAVRALEATTHGRLFIHPPYHYTRLLRDLPFRLHDLRHFSASQLLGRGVDLVTVQRRLGHRSAVTTLQVYSHMIDGNDEAAGRLLGDLLA
ncbi:MAG: tyrosine-type recombinase/integrase [Thermomicrobiales bacterium]